MGAHQSGKSRSGRTDELPFRAQAHGLARASPGFERMRRTGMRCGALLAGLAAFLLVGFGTALFQEGAGQDKKSPKEPWIEEIESVFVRSEVCRQCHDRHYEEMAGLREMRSEEHTSELQSRLHLVCRLLLEKKKKQDK